MTKPLLRALRGEAVTPPPIWLMRQAGRYLPEYRELRKRAKGFLDFCYRPDMACAATLQPIERFAMDAAIVFSDILVVPDAMGVEVSFVEGRGPVVVPVRDAEGVAALRPEGVVERLAPVYETLARVARALPAECALIGFAGAPWTLATYLIEGGSSRDFALSKRWAASDGEGFAEMLEALVTAIVEHLVAQVEAGAEVVQIFDSWAGAVPAAAFERCCVAPVTKIVAQLKTRCPGVLVIAFPRGAGINYQDYAAATGVDCVSLDSGVPVSWGARLDAAAVQGNLDSQTLVVGGKRMREEVGAILSAMAGRGFVFNLGHGVVPETPVENVAELVALVRDGAG